MNGADPGDAEQAIAYGLVIDVAAGHEPDGARIGRRPRAPTEAV
ncbi:hypothetical protein [Streptomyces xanthophaeus]|nr:hypothetical protein [Streptomyces xanthophaeus]